jgi:N-acetyl sugar amidotransferase
VERKKIDWADRWKQLEILCDRYRQDDGTYDCIITGSGGKDSHYQVHILKEKLGMHPLLLNIANYSYTKVGWENFLNWSEVFDCDVISLFIRRKLAKKATRLGFEQLGSPTLLWDRAVYAWPLNMAVKMGIPLVVYGENISYEYGGSQEESPYAYDQINNEATRPIPESWIEHPHDTAFLVYPDTDSITPIYLSYFVPWDGRYHAELMKRWGFKTLAHEWKRQGFVEDYDQVDSAGYLVHPLLKYPKYAHARATDVTSLWVRNGYIDKQTGLELIKQHDHVLDEKAVDDFCAFCGYTLRAFYAMFDTWYNPELFVKVKGLWKSKEWI